jgi:hypothetical protein
MDHTHPLSKPVDRLSRGVHGVRARWNGQQNGQGTQTPQLISNSNAQPENVKSEIDPSPDELDAFSDADGGDLDWSVIDVGASKDAMKQQPHASRKYGMQRGGIHGKAVDGYGGEVFCPVTVEFVCADCKQTITCTKLEEGPESFVLVSAVERGADADEAAEKNSVSSQ